MSIGRPTFDDAAVLHHHDPVRHRQRLGLVVCDVDRGQPDLALDAAQLVAHLDAAGAHRDCSAARRTAAPAAVPPSRAQSRHAAAGRRRAAAPAGRRAAQACTMLKRFHREPLALGLGHAAAFERIGDVLDHRHVRPDRVGLEHHAEIALVRRHEHAGGDVDHCAVADRDASAVGLSRPATQRSVVVLPQPDGPSSVTISPGPTSKSMPATAATRSFCAANVLLRPST